jgi:hypothetical protein
VGQFEIVAQGRSLNPMKPEEIQKMLFVSASEQYGDKYIEHLLEQYKIYIIAAENISDRRQKANEFFLGLNTGLVALLGFVATKTTVTEVTLLVIAAAVAGITMCYCWYRIVLSYKGLNSGKYNVIHAIEQRLPLALYDTEWEAVGRGEDKKLYWPFTHIEWRIPWIFIAIYVLLLVFSIPWSHLIHWACWFAGRV